MRNRRAALVAGGALILLVAAVQHPSADIQILTHHECDKAPRKMQAAVDLGLVAFNLLVTWSARAAR